MIHVFPQRKVPTYLMLAASALSIAILWNPGTLLASGDAAQCGSGLMPDAKLLTGQHIQVYMSMKNTGTTTWKIGEIQLISKSKEWGPTEDKLTQNAAPGQIGNFDVLNLFAPTKPGTYTFEWQIARGSTTFGPKCFQKQIVVEGPKPTITVAFHYANGVNSDFAPDKVGTALPLTILVSNANSDSPTVVPTVPSSIKCTSPVKGDASPFPNTVQLTMSCTPSAVGILKLSADLKTKGGTYHSSNFTLVAVENDGDVSGTADLGVTVTGPTAAKPGSVLRYTVTTTNNGPNGSIGSVEAMLPSLFSFDPAHSDKGCKESEKGTVICYSGFFKAHDSHASTISIKVPSPLPKTEPGTQMPLPGKEHINFESGPRRTVADPNSSNDEAIWWVTVGG